MAAGGALPLLLGAWLLPGRCLATALPAMDLAMDLAMQLAMQLAMSRCGLLTWRGRAVSAGRCWLEQWELPS